MESNIYFSKKIMFFFSLIRLKLVSAQVRILNVRNNFAEVFAKICTEKETALVIFALIEIVR